MLRGLRSPSALVLLVFVACSSPAPAPEAGKSAEAKQDAAVAADSARAEQAAGLSAEELKEVLEPIKIDVRHTCKGMARMRERVDVELTIAGASGAVTHTNVSLDGGNPELASCVAKELQRARFKPAQKVTRTTVSVNF